MKNIRKILRPAAALLLSLAAAGAMAGSQSVSVSIIGPGGHSNGDYGNVNAVHAAAQGSGRQGEGRRRGRLQG